MEQQKIIDVIEQFAPIDSQLSYDKCGIKTGDTHLSLTGVLVCLDLSENIVQQAIENNCNLIIEHHPSIWHSWTQIDLVYPKVRSLLKAANNDITVYSAHTNIDMAKDGLNDLFAKKIGLKNVTTVGEGRIGTVENITLGEYAEIIGRVIDDKNIKIIGERNKIIKNVACINGAGGGEEETILLFAKNSDVFVTSEVKYNVARLSKDIGYAIIEVGHYNAEKEFLPLVRRLIHDNYPEIPVYDGIESDPYQ